MKLWLSIYRQQVFEKLSTSQKRKRAGLNWKVAVARDPVQIKYKPQRVPNDTSQSRKISLNLE